MRVLVRTPWAGWVVAVFQNYLAVIASMSPLWLTDSRHTSISCLHGVHETLGLIAPMRDGQTFGTASHVLQERMEVEHVPNVLPGE